MHGSLSYTLKKSVGQEHFGSHCMALLWSSPVADDEDGYREAEDEVCIDEVSVARLFIQSADDLLGCRGSWNVAVCLLSPLHPTQPVDGRHEPGLTGSAGLR